MSYSSLPFVTSTAHPPDLSAGTWGDISRSQGAILCGVPFFGKCRIDSLETVVFTYGLASTVRAAIALAPTGDNGLPLVTFATYPPGLLVRPWHDVPWC